VAAREDFGRNIRHLRVAAGLSQMELGNRSGLGLAAISRLELAVREPRLRTIVRVAYGLDVPPGELFAGLPREPEAWS
jgi:transcriptional regulator with XRE-family HTH domain